MIGPDWLLFSHVGIQGPITWPEGFDTLVSRGSCSILGVRVWSIPPNSQGLNMREDVGT